MIKSVTFCSFFFCSLCFLALLFSMEKFSRKSQYKLVLLYYKYFLCCRSTIALGAAGWGVKSEWRGCIPVRPLHLLLFCTVTIGLNLSESICSLSSLKHDISICGRPVLFCIRFLCAIFNDITLMHYLIEQKCPITWTLFCMLNIADLQMQQISLEKNI